MSKAEYLKWKCYFEDGQSMMIAGSRDAACRAYSDALRIAETGCVSPAELADTLEGLAVNRRWLEPDTEVGDLFDRAETARQCALDEAIATFGDIHLSTADAYYKFAFHNVMRGRRAVAISYFDKKLGILEALLGERHFEVANTLMIMGATCPEAAEQTELWKRSVSILEYLLDHPGECDANSFREVQPALRGGLENLACQAFSEGRVDDAESYFRRAIAMCTATSGEESCTLCNVATFGKVLLAQQEYDECEAILSQAKSNGGFMKRVCSEVLADLYDQTSRTGEDKALRDLD